MIPPMHERQEPQSRSRRRRRRRQSAASGISMTLALLSLSSSSSPSTADAANTLIVQPSNLPRGTFDDTSSSTFAFSQSAFRSQQQAPDDDAAVESRGPSGNNWLDHEIQSHHDRRNQKQQHGRKNNHFARPQVEVYPLQGSQSGGNIQPREEVDATANIIDSTRPLMISVDQYGAMREAAGKGWANGERGTDNGQMNVGISVDRFGAMRSANDNNEGSAKRQHQSSMTRGISIDQYGAMRSSAGSSANPNNDKPTTSDPGLAEGTQVILRPRPNYSMGNSHAMSPVKLPVMGSANESTNSNTKDISNNNNSPNRVIYYYDEHALQSPSSTSSQSPNKNHQSPKHKHTNNPKSTTVPELTLPTFVYDSTGHPLPLSTLHAQGKNQVFLEVRPQAIWGSDWKSHLAESLSVENLHLSDSLLNSVHNSVRSGNLRSKFRERNEAFQNNLNMMQSQDQMIVFVTVATMAVMVGALSARRLRSRKMLESCMEPDLDEEDEEDWGVDRSKEKGFGSGSRNGNYLTPASGGGYHNDGESYAGDSVGGLSAWMNSGGRLGARRVEGYESFNGNLHWRGDMEKFDV
mmetsp:Transcript_31220/g.64916  ORF Transcript_31220/g.64916 Transcript_31220/m.64916 type:complete len:578 (-) Transcript_31220:311-2044(-)